MKNTKGIKNIIWGIVLVAFGVLLVLNITDVLDGDLFFEGWWTMIIIVPCAVNLIASQARTAAFFGLLVGVVLLLGCRGVIDFSVLWLLLLAVVIITVGFKMIYGSIVSKKSDKITAHINSSGAYTRNETSVFSNRYIDMGNGLFEGANVTTAFGTVKCDLRNAVFAQESVIKVASTFGKIEILVPPYVRVKTNVSSFFGTTMNHSRWDCEKTVTLYISGASTFGTVEIN